MLVVNLARQSDNWRKNIQYIFAYGCQHDYAENATIRVRHLEVVW
jgi:hypothetical protein